jgi:hypothetical protein
MKRVITTLLISILTSSAFADGNARLVVPQPRLVAPQRARACLFAAWVEDHCRFQTFDWFRHDDVGFRACLVANAGYLCEGSY